MHVRKKNYITRLTLQNNSNEIDNGNQLYIETYHQQQQQLIPNGGVQTLHNYTDACVRHSTDGTKRTETPVKYRHKVRTTLRNIQDTARREIPSATVNTSTDMAIQRVLLTVIELRT